MRPPRERDQSEEPGATIAAVAAGKVQAGALNISVWEKFVADGKVDPAKVRVFFTTPTYYDYNWTVHADMPAALREKYFERRKSPSGTTFAAKASIQSRLTFRRLNLATPPFPMKGPLDAVFCR